ncbi:protein translocase subunit SecF [Candidatus Woesearchaeota archaeon]|nr:protein translocase subunit SecF [Candidatus Woesearchaeota archaeon]
MTKRAEKRLKNKKKSSFSQDSSIKEQTEVSDVPKQRSIKNPFLNAYVNHYKFLLLLPLIMLLLAIFQIGFQTATTGDFIAKDISLKGGISITIENVDINIESLQEYLQSNGFNINIRNIQSGGRTIGTIIESDINLNDQGSIDSLLEAIRSQVTFEDYSLEGVGANIGQSFFNQAMIALLCSFILMALIVSITFRTFIPSIAVILAAFSDITITVAIANLLGIKFSTAGLAALLMLIGYSVDTDILLTTRVLKRSEGSLLSRVYSAFKTGVMMNATTIVAIAIALMITSSDIIRQIMVILFIGILVDQINTWIQNVGILRLYIEHKENAKK